MDANVSEVAEKAAPGANGVASSSDTPLRSLRRRLARALVDNVRNGRTALAAGVLHEETSFYLDPDRFPREKQALFREFPLFASLSVELPEPGSYRTFDDAGVPMLLSRGKDGKVRAFLNVCPHRASRIVREPSGKSGRFTCRFHGWTFDSEGKAIGIPDEKNFCAEIDGNKHLVECPADERHGMVFVLPVPGGTMDLDAHLGELGPDLAAIELDKLEVVHADTLSVDANWKYGLDTFFETYHLNALHRETFKGLFSPICVYDTFGPHHRYTFAPLQIESWVDMPEEDWPVDMIPLQFFIFPNTLLAVGSTSPTGSTVNTHQIFPTAVDHFYSVLSYSAMGGVRSEEHRAEVDRAYNTSRSALVTEDYSVAAEAHKGLADLPEGMTLPIGRQEIGVQNFHRNVRRLSGD